MKPVRMCAKRLLKKRVRRYAFLILLAFCYLHRRITPVTLPLYSNTQCIKASPGWSWPFPTDGSTTICVHKDTVKGTWIARQACAIILWYRHKLPTSITRNMTACSTTPAITCHPFQESLWRNLGSNWDWSGKNPLLSEWLLFCNYRGAKLLRVISSFGRFVQ